MASEGTRRALTPHFGSSSKSGRRRADGPAESPGRPYRRPGISTQRPGSTAGDGSRKSTPSWAIAIEQWLCFVLGVICIVCGAFGVLARQVKGPLSGSFAWLGSAYLPTLRVTAFLCFLMGLLLMRRGWSRP